MLTLRIKPRLEFNKWNLYHNSTVATKTTYLDDLEIIVPDSMSVRECSEYAWHQIGHFENTSDLQSTLNRRDRVLKDGVEMIEDSTLKQYCFEQSVQLVLVRQVFILESEFIDFLSSLN